jgi:hypothetical protein
MLDSRAIKACHRCATRGEDDAEDVVSSERVKVQADAVPSIVDEFGFEIFPHM